MKILEELCYGRINPTCRTTSEDKTTCEITSFILGKADELALLLSDEAKEILDQMREMQLDCRLQTRKKPSYTHLSKNVEIVLKKCKNMV